MDPVDPGLNTEVQDGADARARAGWGDAPAGLGFVFLGAAIFFIGYGIWALASSGLSQPRLGLGLAGIALFALIAAPGFRRGRTDRGRSGVLILAEVIGLALIASILTLVAPVGSAVALFFFAGIASSFLRPDRRALLLIGVVIVSGALTMSISNGADWGIPLAIEVGLISLTTYGIGVLRRTNRELLEARSELARLAVSEERSRIARDLHDTLGHSLSLITLKSELAGRLLPDDPVRARAEIGDVEHVARDALASVRETLGGYRQTTLAVELDGVTGALRAAGIDARLENQGLGLSPAADTLLAWTVREGVTNVMRHSHASTCTIRIGRDDAAVFAEIVDDGSGSAPADDRTPGSGLRGLAERAASLGGSLVAGPLSEGGYRLRVTLPGATASPALA